MSPVLTLSLSAAAEGAQTGEGSPAYVTIAAFEELTTTLGTSGQVDSDAFRGGPVESFVELLPFLSGPLALIFQGFLNQLGGGAATELGERLRPLLASLPGRRQTRHSLTDEENDVTCELDETVASDPAALRALLILDWDKFPEGSRLQWSPQVGAWLVRE